ncbi:hypothetical protein DFJ74DRAFT_702102 [Hyaloraphidium curvatum]|nr:hypothetical protein DFJ74DRAFT_702102 [Hyaloraphidium curvatum]
MNPAVVIPFFGSVTGVDGSATKPPEGAAGASAPGHVIGSEGADGPPRVPPELLEHIALHLKPGSKALLEFALCSRASFDLLAPRFFETFHPTSRDRSGFAGKVERWLASVTAQRCLGCVRTIQLHAAQNGWQPGAPPIEAVLARILSACDRAKELHVHLGFEDNRFFRSLRSESLVHLCVEVSDGTDPNRYLPLTWELPSVKELWWGGILTPQLVTAIALGFPRLESWDARYVRSVTPHHIPAALVRTIRGWKFYNEADFARMASHPAFAPRRLAFIDTKDAPWSWAAACSEGCAAREVIFQELSSRCFAQGLPPSAETVSVTHSFSVESVSMDELRTMEALFESRPDLELDIRGAVQIPEMLAHGDALESLVGQADLLSSAGVKMDEAVVGRLRKRLEAERRELEGFGAAPWTD